MVLKNMHDVWIILSIGSTVIFGFACFREWILLRRMVKKRKIIYEQEVFNKEKKQTEIL